MTQRNERAPTRAAAKPQRAVKPREDEYEDEDLSTASTRKQIIRTMSLHEAKAQGENEPLYILNTSARSGSVGQLSRLLISIQRGSGIEPTRVDIEDTWLPQDLSLITSRSSILGSDQFLSFLNQHKCIELITKEYAHQLMETPNARREADRLENVKRQLNAATAMRGIAGEIKGAEGQEDSLTRSRNGRYVDEDAEVSGRFEREIQVILDSSLTDNDAHDDLRAKAPFSLKQLHFLRDKFAETSFVRCQRTINNSIRRREAESVDPSDDE